MLMVIPEPSDLTADFFVFRPDPRRAQAVDACVRAGLADSLAAVFKALGDRGPRRGSELVARVRAKPVSPAVFAMYTDIVEAIFGDNVDVAVRLADELSAVGYDSADNLRIVTLSDEFLGLHQAERYRRLVDDDQESELDLEALAPAAFVAAASRISETLALLDSVDPPLAGEIHSLVRQVVVAESSDEEFGASSFQVWGALFLRLKDNWGRVEIAGALAHESAHALLFGFGMGKPLVRNPPNARYSSPLRADPRPMDGVVHASYVIARMHYTATCLLGSGALTNEEERVALEARTLNERRFTDGWGVICRHAELTPEGEAALASANAYMLDGVKA
jgi:HEXXH motif-containing protein